jgi:uncharacterized protein
MSVDGQEERYESLDPRVVNLWRLDGLSRLLFFWFPLAGGAVAFAAMRGVTMVGVVAAAVVIGLNLISTIVLPAMAWQRFRYAVRAQDLLVERGVLFRRTISIPLDRVQHVDTRQGPMERAFGLSNVIVYTAAGLSADGSIPGLDEEHAAQLRDVLSRRSADDGV